MHDFIHLHANGQLALPQGAGLCYCLCTSCVPTPSVLPAFNISVQYMCIMTRNSTASGRSQYTLTPGSSLYVTAPSRRLFGVACRLWPCSWIAAATGPFSLWLPLPKQACLSQPFRSCSPNWLQQSRCAHTLSMSTSPIPQCGSGVANVWF